MSIKITFENMLIFILPVMEVVFLASVIIGTRRNKKAFKIISFVAITAICLSICILLWVNKTV
ncbi:hypothetical protein LGL55_23280 [Clostridium tagluense]|uniref:hypothetical protein n=1 Tax=Clostridium TaxID=1485 RepID=UPI0013E95924|nr:MULTISPECIES: hypothetical protein [Clostridium]MBU3130362.1 hypothetical protein [Clostridium tagluense]MBW9159577.1 hypothetical protein [Clostridium tagluense]MBZ9623139.1 hypothetical protein [Clostridium sp. FP2]MCB2313953.1 hypothetical protein [Clostridium tagluense]MCB2319012.1 hypothetical protein [Clostridium tagluense]